MIRVRRLLSNKETTLTIRLSLAAGLLAFLCAACSVGGDSGIAPPLDRVFLPSGAAVDATGRWLLVVNSNTDLRYSFGTVVPLDLAKATADRQKTWPSCPSTTYRPKAGQGNGCCRDLLDGRILNCDDRQYAEPSATVRVGSFATAPVVQRFQRDGQLVERLFFGVRADPSVTYVDVTSNESGVQLRCAGIATEGAPPQNPRCDGVHRVEEGTIEGQKVLLPEEPFSLKLDEGLGVLYVGHLFGGLSALDVCAPEARAPRIAALAPDVYGGQGAGVTSITPLGPGEAAAPVMTTARNGQVLGQLYFRSAANLSACLGDRDLTLIPAAPLAASSFDPRGGDTRGLLVQPEKARAFVLHRNTSNNPAALARMTLSLDTRGRTQFAPAEAIDVCPGPSELLLHDAGRGPRLYIPCFESGQVYVVDPELMVVTEMIEAGRGPSMMTFDPVDAALAYIVGYVDNNVSVVDLRPGSPTEGRVVQRLGFPRISSQL